MDLIIENLSKELKENKILNDINLQLEPGIYGLLGPIGMGKTKLLEVILGLIYADSGHIYIDDKLISTDDEEYKSILGYLPKNFLAYPELTIYEYMLYISNLKRIEVGNLNKYILDLLEKFQLLEYKDNKTKSLDYNQMKRLGLAQALINDPRILLLDQPTVGLEDKQRAKISNLIYSLKEDRIILISTHIVDAIQYIVDKIILLKDGKIIDFNNIIELSKILIDKVWESTLGYDEFRIIENKYIVTKVETEADEFKTRIISKQQPNKNWEKVYPSLTDIYLYHFGQVI